MLAVPMGIAIGLFLSELAPGYLRTPIGMLVELLAAIPSVILGLWGIIVMGPFLAQHIEPWLTTTSASSRSSPDIPRPWACCPPA